MTDTNPSSPSSCARSSTALPLARGPREAWERGKSKPRMVAKAAIIAIGKFGRREVHQRLAIMVEANRDKVPAARRR